MCFAVVDLTAWFLTQPKLPRMALITPRVEEEGEGEEVLVLAAPGVVLLRVPIVAVAGGERGRPPPVTVAVWRRLPADVTLKHPSYLRHSGRPAAIHPCD